MSQSTGEILKLNRVGGWLKNKSTLKLSEGKVIGGDGKKEKKKLSKVK